MFVKLLLIFNQRLLGQFLFEMLTLLATGIMNELELPGAQQLSFLKSIIRSKSGCSTLVAGPSEAFIDRALFFVEKEGYFMYNTVYILPCHGEGRLVNGQSKPPN